MIQRVRSGLIDTNAIGANNIATGAITGDKIGATSVNANNIANGAITSVKLAEPNAFEDYFLLGSL